MRKNVLYTIIGLGVIVSSLTESCSSTNLHENCKIIKISRIHIYNDSTYSVRVLFNNKMTKEQRKAILSQRLTEDYPQLILCDEHIGKRYNEYWYTLKARDTSTIQILHNCIADTVNYLKTPDDIVNCLAEVGTDDIPVLNECESKCLNYLFQKERGLFDFSEKKAAFFRGSGGRIRTSKEWYFNQKKMAVRFYGEISTESPAVQLVFFSEEEAKKIGYDVVIFLDSKRYIKKKDAIARLKTMNKPNCRTKHLNP